MKRDTLIIVGSLMAAALIAFFLIWPEVDAMGAKKEDLVNKDTQIADLKAFAEKIKTLNDKYNMNPDELEKFLSVLPKEEEVPKLLIQLESLATENGLIMGSVDFRQVENKIVAAPVTAEDAGMFSGSQGSGSGAAAPLPLPTAPPATYKTLAVSLKLSGGYDAFKSYLVAVEKNVRLMDVTSLGLGGGEQGNYSFSVSLNVYYQPK